MFSFIQTRTFEDGRDPVRTPASRVTVTFEDRDGGGFVRLVHEDIQTEDGRAGVGSGWEGTFNSLVEIYGALPALQP